MAVVGARVALDWKSALNTTNSLRD